MTTPLTAQSTGLTRRHLLGLAGASVMAPSLGAPPATFIPEGGFCLDLDLLEGAGGPDLQIVGLAASYSHRAIAEAIAGIDQAMIASRLDEGAEIFALAQRRSSEFGYEIRLNQNEIGLNLPPLTSNLLFANFEANLAVLGEDNKLLAALLAALGLDGLGLVIIAVLNEAPGAPSLSYMSTLLAERRWKELGAELTKLLKYMTSKDFFKRLAKKIGGKAVKDIGIKISSRLIPFVGVALVVASVIYVLLKC